MAGPRMWPVPVSQYRPGVGLRDWDGVRRGVRQSELLTGGKIGISDGRGFLF